MVDEGKDSDGVEEGVEAVEGDDGFDTEGVEVGGGVARVEGGHLWPASGRTTQ